MRLQRGGKISRGRELRIRTRRLRCRPPRKVRRRSGQRGLGRGGDSRTAPGGPEGCGRVNDEHLLHLEFDGTGGGGGGVSHSVAPRLRGGLLSTRRRQLSDVSCRHFRGPPSDGVARRKPRRMTRTAGGRYETYHTRQPQGGDIGSARADWRRGGR